MTPGAIVPIPPMVIVYHGVEPSVEDSLTPKEHLRNVSDKANYSVWVLSATSEHGVVSMVRTAGAEIWAENLVIMLSELIHPSFITNEGACAIDDLCTQTFTSLETERVRIPRAFGSGLSSSSSVRGSGSAQSSSSSTGSRPQSGQNTRATSPVGTRGATMERELASENARRRRRRLRTPFCVSVSELWMQREAEA